MTNLRRIAQWAVAAALAVIPLYSQSSYERTFPQSKDAVEKAVKNLQGNLAGHLPALEGFAQPGQYPLGSYQRAYYQATIEVFPAAAGGSVVKVSAKVTAWYNDPASSHSGYQLLISNGRLESDILDQLSDVLGKTAVASATKPAAVPAKPAPAPATNPAVAPSRTPAKETTPDPRFAESMRAALNNSDVHAYKPDPNGKVDSELQRQADDLEQVLKNQAHPKNLVAVKKSGTPVVGSPSLTAKPMFLASQHDEFEMLDFNSDWVHVRISGLSRGWIWRNSLEMPEGIPDTAAHAPAGLSAAGDLFHVVREETAPFPGDWEPLRGKNVKIISVQQNDENSKDTGSKARLEYAKGLLEKSYSELAGKQQDLLGIVVIFDSSDGGMIAATLPTLQQWKAGTLSDSALWHKCFFDPPETFESSGTGGSQ
jgi:hypothetical protein